MMLQGEDFALDVRRISKSHLLEGPYDTLYFYHYELHVINSNGY